MEAIPLQRTAFMAFRQIEDTPSLEVYTFSANEPTSAEPCPILRAVYRLPSLQNGVEITMQCRCDPPPFQYSHLVHPDIPSMPIETPSYLRRPFEIQEGSRIVVIAFNATIVLNPEQSRDFAIFVPLQTFISTNLDPEAPQGEPRVFPASEWMCNTYLLDDISLLGQWCVMSMALDLPPCTLSRVRAVFAYTTSIPPLFCMRSTTTVVTAPRISCGNQVSQSPRRM